MVYSTPCTVGLFCIAVGSAGIIFTCIECIYYIINKLYYEGRYQLYKQAFYHTIKAISMYHFSLNPLYLEHLAYDRYEYSKERYHSDWLRCPSSFDKFGCNCSRKILLCGCVLCHKITIQYHKYNIWFNYNLYVCEQCGQFFTINLTWDYNQNRGKELRKYLIDGYIKKNININMIIPNDINNLITQFYILDNRDIIRLRRRRKQWAECKDIESQQRLFELWNGEIF